MVPRLETISSRVMPTPLSRTVTVRASAIERDADLELAVALVEPVVGQRLEAELVRRVRRHWRSARAGRSPCCCRASGPSGPAASGPRSGTRGSPSSAPRPSHNLPRARSTDLTMRGYGAGRRRFQALHGCLGHQPTATILVPRLSGQVDAMGGRAPWERGHPPPPPCGGRLARLNTCGPSAHLRAGRTRSQGGTHAVPGTERGPRGSSASSRLGRDDDTGGAFPGSAGILPA